uniref:CCHC-type domain-containing protein n=1 Tax=Meloidogyne hapla TaxID=6305 RepID=A0A1I8AYP9_MELHA
MSRPLKSLTKRAALSVQELLDKKVPKEPDALDDEYLLALCETHDQLNNDIEDLSEAHSDLKEVNSKWTSLILRCNQAEKAANENAYEEMASFYKIEERLNEAETRLTQLKALERKLKSEKRKEENKERMSINNTSVSQKPSGFNFKPPRQEIGKFSGNQTDWPDWWETFEATIHRSEEKDEIKHAVLKQCVEGEAKSLIAGLKLSDYKVALDLLEQRYGDTEEYTRSLYSQLENLKSCQNFQDCQKFSIEVERICRLLENNGQDISGQGIWMSLEKKLTIPILREVQNKKELAKILKIEWDTSAFRKALREVIEKEELVLTIHHKAPENELEAKYNPKGSKNFPDEGKNSDEPEITSTFANTEVFEKRILNKRATPNKIAKNNGLKIPERGRRFPIYPCIYCGKNGHWGYECQRIRTAEERRKKLLEIKRCVQCIKPEHKGNCKRPIRCFHCQGRHNTALCKNTYGQEKESQTIMAENLSDIPCDETIFKSNVIVNEENLENDTLEEKSEKIPDKIGQGKTFNQKLNENEFKKVTFQNERYEEVGQNKYPSNKKPSKNKMAKNKLNEATFIERTRPKYKNTVIRTEKSSADLTNTGSSPKGLSNQLKIIKKTMVYVLKALNYLVIKNEDPKNGFLQKTNVEAQSPSIQTENGTMELAEIKLLHEAQNMLQRIMGKAPQIGVQKSQIKNDVPKIGSQNSPQKYGEAPKRSTQKFPSKNGEALKISKNKWIKNTNPNDVKLENCKSNSKINEEKNEKYKEEKTSKYKETKYRSKTEYFPKGKNTGQKYPYSNPTKLGKEMAQKAKKNTDRRRCRIYLPTRIKQKEEMLVKNKEPTNESRINKSKILTGKKEEKGPESKMVRKLPTTICTSRLNDFDANDAPQSQNILEGGVFRPRSHWERIKVQSTKNKEILN